MKVHDHTYAGCTYPGRAGMGEILKELERQHAARSDHVLPGNRLKVLVCDKDLLLSIPKPGGSALVPFANRAFIQLMARVGLPSRTRLANWLIRGHQNPGSAAGRQADPRAHWDVLAKLFNEYLQREKPTMLVRIMKDKGDQAYCRALLSDQYKIIPNLDYFHAIVESLREAKAEIWHARLSDDHFWMYAVAPHISGEISTDRAYDPGDGWRSRWTGKKGDVLNAAMAAGNSETGCGGYYVAHAVVRRVCENYCVWHNVVAKTHVGKRQEADTMLSDETIAEENKLTFMKIGDYVKGTFDPEVFKEMIDKLDEATKDVIEDPEEAAEALQVVYDLSEKRKEEIRNMFIREQDNSRYGLINAVTRYAHEGEKDCEAGYDLEALSKDLAYTDMDKMKKKADSIKKLKPRTDAAELVVAASEDLM